MRIFIVILTSEIEAWLERDWSADILSAWSADVPVRPLTTFAQWADRMSANQADETSALRQMSMLLLCQLFADGQFANAFARRSKDGVGDGR